MDSYESKNLNDCMDICRVPDTLGLRISILTPLVFTDSMNPKFFQQKGPTPRFDNDPSTDQEKIPN